MVRTPHAFGALAAGLWPLFPALAAAPSPTPTPTPVPGEVRVSVTVTGADRKRGPAPNAVVWLPGSAAPLGAPPGDAALRARIASQAKRFEPRILAVPAGTTVDFPNLDRIFHNVFSLSPNAKFDLGLYRNGASRPMTFEAPGLVRIYCNIHTQMAAFLLVVDGKIHGQTGPDGTVLLTGIPPGRHGVRVWDEKGGDFTGSVDVASGRTASLTVALDAASFKETPHKNKYGKDYPPPDDDDNRY